jgi:hypothetical protein
MPKQQCRAVARVGAKETEKPIGWGANAEEEDGGAQMASGIPKTF